MDSSPVLRNPPLVALAGWLVPGLGYWFLGQRWRAITIGVTILIVFVLGLLIGGIKVVDAPDGFANIAQKPWFIGQILAGPVSVVSAVLADRTKVMSHAHSWEIGTLYTAVAGMLNLLAIIDSAHRASQESGA